MSISATPINAVSISVSWNISNSNSGGQYLDYTVSGPGLSAVNGTVYSGGSASGSATATGLSPNTPYTYTVSGVYADGTSYSGGSTVAYTQTAGYATVSPSFSGSGTSGTLSWTNAIYEGGGAVTGVYNTASYSPGGTFSVPVSPISVSGLTSGTTYTFTVRVYYTSNGYSSYGSGSTTYTATGTTTYPPAWTDNTLAAFSYNVPYSDGVTASNMSYSGSYSVSAGSLPTGISLNTSTGAVTGTPTVNGQSYSFTLKATNTYGNTTRSFSGTVTSTSPAWTDNVLAPFVVNKAYSDSVTAVNVTSYSLTGTLPDGITWSSSTRTLSGTPTGNSYAYNFTITATGSGGSVSQQYVGYVGGMVSVFDGTSWITKPVKVRGTSTWTIRPVYIYNGSSWVPSV